MLEHTRGWLGKRDRWLFWVVGLALGGAYWPIKEHLKGLGWETVTLSNISTNLVLMFFAWGYFCPGISHRLWNVWLMRRGLKPVGGKQVPFWFRWGLFAVVMLVLIYYMTLWGQETRW